MINHFLSVNSDEYLTFLSQLTNNTQENKVSANVYLIANTFQHLSASNVMRCIIELESIFGYTPIELSQLRDKTLVDLLNNIKNRYGFEYQESIEKALRK